MFRVTVKQAAHLLGKSLQFVRMGIQSGQLPIGTYVDCGEKHSRGSYYISPVKLADFIGISCDMLKEEIGNGKTVY